MLHGLLVVGAIGLIAVAPCLVCLLLISADEVLERAMRACKRVVRKVARRKEREPKPGWRDGPVGGGGT